LTTTVADYIGRKVDVSAFQGWKEVEGAVLLEESLAAPGEGGRVVSGVALLAQRVLRMLRTPRGGRLFDEQDGAFFATKLASGRLRTKVDVEKAFSEAAFLIQGALNAEDGPDDPDDQRLELLELEEAEVREDRFLLRVRIVSRAGESRRFIEPIPLVL
jgi:hypothetical protein